MENNEEVKVNEGTGVAPEEKKEETPAGEGEAQPEAQPEATPEGEAQA